MKRVILASQSPRRKEILQQVGLDFEVFPSEIDEMMDDNLSISENIEGLALRKAKAAAHQIQGEAVVIGADTIVLLEKVLGKPRNKDEAKDMLSLLSGKTHRVITGLGIIDTCTGEGFSSHQVTYVTMKNYTSREIESYIDSGEYMDKAGSYGIQGLGALLVKEIRGDYFNVVGLPVGLLDDMLKRVNINILK